eukprot:TRINITY_DN15059_c0_g2_i5.p1 TRINITY_DN15059_c0_g2~~TRINITY_DN15059_c0_g2_i5.p1  ORF type:complete len:752 (+),score=165.63 TRINITY_DN15059_c0_g2_i5:80-2257(+)
MAAAAQEQGGPDPGEYVGEIVEITQAGAARIRCAEHEKRRPGSDLILLRSRSMKQGMVPGAQVVFKLAFDELVGWQAHSCELAPPAPAVATPVPRPGKPTAAVPVPRAAPAAAGAAPHQQSPSLPPHNATALPVAPRTTGWEGGRAVPGAASPGTIVDVSITKRPDDTKWGMWVRNTPDDDSARVLCEVWDGTPADRAGLGRYLLSEVLAVDGAPVRDRSEVGERCQGKDKVVLRLLVGAYQVDEINGEPRRHLLPPPGACSSAARGPGAGRPAPPPLVIPQGAEARRAATGPLDALPLKGPSPPPQRPLKGAAPPATAAAPSSRFPNLPPQPPSQPRRAEVAQLPRADAALLTRADTAQLPKAEAPRLPKAVAVQPPPPPPPQRQQPPPPPPPSQWQQPPPQPPLQQQQQQQQQRRPPVVQQPASAYPPQQPQATAPPQPVPAQGQAPRPPPPAPPAAPAAHPPAAAAAAPAGAEAGGGAAGMDMEQWAAAQTELHGTALPEGQHASAAPQWRGPPGCISLEMRREKNQTWGVRVDKRCMLQCGVTRSDKDGHLSALGLRLEREPDLLRPYVGRRVVRVDHQGGRVQQLVHSFTEFQEAVRAHHEMTWWFGPVESSAAAAPPAVPQPRPRLRTSYVGGGAAAPERGAAEGGAAQAAPDGGAAAQPPAAAAAAAGGPAAGAAPAAARSAGQPAPKRARFSSCCGDEYSDQWPANYCMLCGKKQPN